MGRENKEMDKISKIDAFVNELKEKKEFTYKEIVDFMDKEGLTPEELDKLYSNLEKAGINISKEDIESTKEKELEEMDDDDDDDIKEAIVEKIASGEVSAAESLAELDIEPNLEDITEIEKNILFEDINDMSFIDNISVDDPVRMFLKEIGKIELLSLEVETELANKMVNRR